MTVPVMPPTPVSTQDAGVVVSAPRFPRTARVRAKAEFSAVFDRGRRTAEPRMALHWLADAAPARLGLAVSRKVDPHAVGRNRIKRSLREAFRHLRGRLPGGAYVVVARSGAALVQRIGAVGLDGPGQKPLFRRAAGGEGFGAQMVAGFE